jgi:hypothetical protein
MEIAHRSAKSSSARRRTEHARRVRSPDLAINADLT